MEDTPPVLMVLSTVEYIVEIVYCTGSTRKVPVAVGIPDVFAGLKSVSVMYEVITSLV